jgi:phage replication O-like protein O
MANDTDVSEQFTKYPNRILDALCSVRLPGEAEQVLKTIARLTYGYHKDKAEISMSLFHKKTGIYPPNVNRAINALESMKIILTDRTPGRKTLYRINSDIEDWKPKPKQRANKRQTVISSDNSSELLSVPIIGVISSDNSSVISSDNSTVISSDNSSSYKKESFKESIKKTHKESLRASEFSFSDFLKTATDFCEKVFQYHPKCKHESVEMSAKILAGIGESPDEISRAIEFGFADTEFWRSILKSATQFAKNFGTIQSQMNRVKKVSRTSNQKTLKRMLDELTGFE